MFVYFRIKYFYIIIINVIFERPTIEVIIILSFSKDDQKVIPFFFLYLFYSVDQDVFQTIF